MNVLVTGAFGNVGKSTLDELVRQGHTVRCFDVPTRQNRRTALKILARYRDPIEVIWGDLRRPQDVLAAVQDQDAVVHLAFILPKLSATGVESEKAPDWAREVNVGGTQNLIEAMKAQPTPPKLLFTSSVHVFGCTQDQAPPRTILDPVRPLEHYACHKVECERMVHASGLTWTILRLAASMPFAIQLDPGMFDVPLDNRMEYVHSRDVALAIAHAIVHENVWGRLLLIGGGPRCQYRFREIVERILGAVGVGMLPDEAFTTRPFATDWMDTAVSQELLRYQQRTLDDYLVEMKAALGVRCALAKAFRPLVRRWLLSKSPYYPARGVRAPRSAKAIPAASVPVQPDAVALTSGELSPELRQLFIETARDLRGRARRLFMARTVQALGRDGQQRAERELGWPRELILSGMRELGKHTV